MTVLDRPGAQDWVPDGGGIPALRTAASECRGCELWEPATQVVFSKGPASAPLVLVGEQPGDQEDRAGEPFVGPAGRVLDRALAEVGIAGSAVYISNAVKHFRFQQGPKRRLHQTPELAHIVACKPWLSAELAVVDPVVLVCLGATAVRSVLGTKVKVMKDRGRLIPNDELPLEPAGRNLTFAMVTIHPSAVLRADDREAAYGGLVADLSVAAAALA